MHTGGRGVGFRFILFFVLKEEEINSMFCRRRGITWDEGRDNRAEGDGRVAAELTSLRKQDGTVPGQDTDS